VGRLGDFVTSAGVIYWGHRKKFGADAQTARTVESVKANSYFRELGGENTAHTVVRWLHGKKKTCNKLFFRWLFRILLHVFVQPERSCPSYFGVP
jgi:hypothetical protein